MSHLLVYLIVMLGSISNLFAIIGALFLIGFAFFTIFFVVTFDPTFSKDFRNTEKSRKAFKKWAISLLCVGFLFVSLSHLTPNMKEAAAIYLIPKVANNEHVQEMPDKALEMLNEKMNDYLEEMKSDNEEGEE